MHNIPIIILIDIAIILLIGWFVVRGRGSMVMYSDEDMEEMETKPSMYRGEEVTQLVSVIDYWLSDILPDNAQPHVYSTDDFTSSFVSYATMNGLFKMEVIWRRHKLRLHYAMHDEAAGECKEIWKTIKMSDHRKLVEFLIKAKEIELSLDASAVEWIENLRDIALSAERQEECKDKEVADLLITHWVFLTSYVEKQKNPNPILVVAYTNLLTLLYAKFPEEFKAFLDEHTAVKDEN